jgi:CRP-like cAMP-binding protein/GNAT superfamily N-acetyltransferase
MSTNVRFATTDADREAIWRLRHRVYVEEMGYDFGSMPEGRLPDMPPRGNRLLLAEQEGGVVGTLAIDWGGDQAFGEDDRQVFQLDRFLAVVPPDGLMIVTRFLSLPEARRGPAPAMLLDATLRFALDHGVAAIFLDCRPALINFYLRLGFRPYAPTTSHPIPGILVPMLLLLDDHAHLLQARSRFAALACSRAADLERLAKLAALLPATSPVQTLAAKAGDWPALAGELSRKAELLEGLDEGEVQHLLDQGTILTCAPGQPIVVQGNGDRTVFLMLEGLAEVWRDGAAVGIVGPGGTFGEVALLTGRPRIADVVAATQCRLLSLRDRTLAMLVQDDSALAAKLLRNLATGLAEKLAAER